jgi:hypothetical protein
MFHRNAGWLSNGLHGVIFQKSLKQFLLPDLPVECTEHTLNNLVSVWLAINGVLDWVTGFIATLHTELGTTDNTALSLFYTLCSSPFIHSLTHSLTHSWSSALLNKVPIVQPLKKFPAFYGTRRFITVVPIPSQINPIRTIPSYLSKIHFNTVHLHTSWSSQWSLTFWLYQQYPIRIPLLPIRATWPAHLILLDTLSLQFTVTHTLGLFSLVVSLQLIYNSLSVTSNHTWSLLFTG